MLLNSFTGNKNIKESLLGAIAYTQLGVRCLSMAQNAMIGVKQRMLEEYKAVNS